jgi:hypothetical protein
MFMVHCLRRCCNIQTASHTDFITDLSHSEKRASVLMSAYAHLHKLLGVVVGERAVIDEE